MQTHYISEMLHIPELHIQNVKIVDDNQLHITVSPITKKQNCSLCETDQWVTLKGSNGFRKIRHLPAFEKIVYLLTPAIRMHCSHCHTSFVWSYAFVEPKKRYSKLFQKRIVEQTLGSTAAHSARMEQIPASTVQRMHHTTLPLEHHRLSEQAWQQAEDNNNLVLGIDDFSIKKGHRYNTGIHDLRGGTMLDLLPGRTLEDLRTYAKQHPSFLQLSPKAVVMDLARAYHTWISECFPMTTRIADRFHVHGYVIEALQEVRKSVQYTLIPRMKVRLKANHRLLNPQEESLSSEHKGKLQELLSYSPLLRAVWEWKESFTAWYDYSPSIDVATTGFIRWCKQGERIDHVAITNALKTMRNWQSEIINYHHCRWTNATVEGRHNRIKAFQRRHYFIRNYERYKAGILVECNRHRILS